jgi:hypothetical protein
MASRSKYRFVAALLVFALASPATGSAQTKMDPAHRCPKSDQAFEPYLLNPSLSDDLQNAREAGLLVVSYSRCRIRLLPHCTLETQYRFTKVNRSRLTKYILNRQDLYKMLSFDAIEMAADFGRRGTLSLSTAFVGYYETPVKSAGAKQLHGDCQGATHFVRRFDTGAYFLQNKTIVKSAPQVAILKAGGVFERCLVTATDALGPECQSVIKLTLVPLLAKSAMPPSSPHPLLGQLPGAQRVRLVESTALGRSMEVPTANRVNVVLFWDPNVPASIAALGELANTVQSLDPNTIQAVAAAVNANPLRAQQAVSGKMEPIYLAVDDGRLKRRYKATGTLPAIFVIDSAGYVRFYEGGHAPDMKRVANAIHALVGK